MFSCGGGYELQQNHDQSVYEAAPARKPIASSILERRNIGGRLDQL